MHQLVTIFKREKAYEVTLPVNWKQDSVHVESMCAYTCASFVVLHNTMPRQ